MKNKLTHVIRTCNRLFVSSIPKFILILFFVSLTSCSLTYRIYQGDPLPPEKIAVLKIPGGINLRETVRILAVDGVRHRNFYGSGWDGTGQIEFLPGKHSIIVFVRIQGFQSFERNINFAVEAGKTYVVRHELIGGVAGYFYEIVVQDELTKKEKYKIDPY